MQVVQICQLAVPNGTTSTHTHCCTIRLARGENVHRQMNSGKPNKLRKGTVVAICSVSQQTVHVAGEMQIVSAYQRLLARQRWRL